MAIAGAPAARSLKSKGATKSSMKNSGASGKTKAAFTRMSKTRGGFKK